MNGREKLLDMFIMAGDLAFECGQSGGQVFMSGHEPPKTVEGSDDLDAGGNGDRRPEDGREHDGAVLGEGKGREFWIAMLLGTGRNLRPVQGVHFYSGKPEHEVARKSLFVSSNLFVEAFGSNAIDPREICIEHDAAIPDGVDELIDGGRDD